jgi:hypothetical protein
MSSAVGPESHHRDRRDILALADTHEQRGAEEGGRGEEKWMKIQYCGYNIGLEMFTGKQAVK